MLMRDYGDWGALKTKCAGKVSLFDRKFKKRYCLKWPQLQRKHLFFFVCLTDQLRLQIFESFPWPEYTMKLWIFSCQSAHCSCFPRFRVGCCWKDPRGREIDLIVIFIMPKQERDLLLRAQGKQADDGCFSVWCGNWDASLLYWPWIWCLKILGPVLLENVCCVKYI